MDEAHATGVLDDDHAARADIRVMTASKALGALGGIILGPDLAIETVLNEGRAFIYTTGAMPAQAAAIDEALNVLRDEPDRRARLRNLAKSIRAELAPLGVRPFETDPTHIIPIIVGETHDAARAHAALAERGILTSLVRPPTVAPGTARLRLSLHVGLSDADADRVCDAARVLF